MKISSLVFLVVLWGSGYFCEGSNLAVFRTGANTFSIHQQDSFKYYYKQLKNILKRNPYNKTQQCRAAVSYMENQTNINAHPDGNYFGWFLFTKNDLIAWRKWKKHNK